jgi:predicted TPR repeat methyltransferase
MAGETSLRDLSFRMSPDTTSQAFFESMYRAKSDPWNFASNRYELNRYEAILRALQQRSYRHAFEPGCSIGMLTEQLASICGRIDAIDISPTAVLQAQKRCQSFANVHIGFGALPHHIPAGIFDLVIFSEIGYYFGDSLLKDLMNRILGRMSIGGTLLAAHWLGTSPDHLLTGDRVHEIIHQTDGLAHKMAERHNGFRIDRWERI